ncbi:signal peptidase II [Reinekea sp.]|jgi:signal peptidase II|uniref:signal peptidase II n=1 Tax=Reinekea sp. TaxID=1970455 RepID=UPI003989E13B
MSLTLKTRLKILLPLMGIAILIDQLSKVWAVSYLKSGPRFSYLFDSIRILYAENHGAFLGLGNSLSPNVRFWIFTALVGVFLTALLVYVLIGKEIDRIILISLTLVLAGGFSNFIDRAMNNGGVVDFINMGIGTLRTGIFNIADVYIMIGAGLMILGPYVFKEQTRA